MKKTLLFLSAISLLFVNSIIAQCVPSCSVYATTTVAFAPVSVAGHNTVTSFSSLDDGLSSSLPIGFTFTFFCVPYTNFIAATNGFITFDLSATNSGCCNGLSIPTTASPDNFIAFHWNDLNLNGGGSVTYTTIGTAPNRQCIITYTDVAHYGSTSLFNSGQIKLFETTNEIEIHSALVTTDNGNGSQGIENSTGTIGYPAPGCNATTFTLSNQAYKWFAGGAPTPPTSISGSTIVCQGYVETYLATTMPTASSYNWSFPPGWIGTSSLSAINATTGTSGNVSVTATYSCGTSAATTLSVTVIPAPVLSISSTSAIICSGQSLTINGTGNGVVNYTLDPLGTTGMPPFVVSPALTTVYTLVGENSLGCVSNNSASVTVSVKETPTVQVNSGAICLGQSFTMSPTGATTYFYSSIFNIVTPLTVGVSNYSVTGTNSTGCISDPAVSSVTVNALPNVNLNANRPVICMKESSTLTATGATTYSWNNNTSSASVLTVSPLSTTIYTVTGTQAGCSKSATIAVTVNACVGLFEQNASNNSEIQIFPNPSNGEFMLITEKSISVSIQDVSGKIIYSKELSEGTHKINLNEFANGNYFLKTSDGENKQSRVLIKQ